MKKCILMLLTLSLLVCTAAHAMEPPAVDLSDFAAELERKGYPIPKTLDEAIGDTAFGTLPEYELIVDKQNDQYILKLDAEGEVSAELAKYIGTDIELQPFKKAGALGVYTAKGIGDYDELGINISNDDGRYFQEDSYWFELSTDRCVLHSFYVYDISGSLSIQKMLRNDSQPTFQYIALDYIANEVRYGVSILFRIGMEDAVTCSLNEKTPTGSVAVIYRGGNLDRIEYNDFIYLGQNGYWSTFDENGVWSPDSPTCTAPFEVTPDMYPYPDFLP